MVMFWCSSPTASSMHGDLSPRLSEIKPIKLLSQRLHLVGVAADGVSVVGREVGFFVKLLQAAGISSKPSYFFFFFFFLSCSASFSFIPWTPPPRFKSQLTKRCCSKLRAAAQSLSIFILFYFIYFYLFIYLFF
jgi:hypothetical protein